MQTNILKWENIFQKIFYFKTNGAIDTQRIWKHFLQELSWHACTNSHPGSLVTSIFYLSLIICHIWQFLLSEHPQQVWQMCQMPNIWHICHTKHKNGALWDVPNLKNYTTWLQYCCKFATVRTDVAKILLFYIPFSLSSLFIFSFLFSLTLWFPLSSTSPRCSPATTTV